MKGASIIDSMELVELIDSTGSVVGHAHPGCPWIEEIRSKIARRNIWCTGGQILAGRTKVIIRAAPYWREARLDEVKDILVGAL